MQERHETDDRFPTGEWTGFFLQPQVMRGKFPMSLNLTFSQGRIDGDGQDAVGVFIMTGRYDLKTGQVWLEKRYVNRHDVHYKGYADGTNKGIWGTWEMGESFRGGFHIWPKGMPDPTGSTLKAEAELPVEEEVGVLVGSPALVEDL